MGTWTLKVVLRRVDDVDEDFVGFVVLLAGMRGGWL